VAVSKDGPQYRFVIPGTRYRRDPGRLAGRWGRDQPRLSAPNVAQPAIILTRGLRRWASVHSPGHDPEKRKPVFGADHAPRKEQATSPIQRSWIRL
jgi:hypothetical protein